MKNEVRLDDLSEAFRRSIYASAAIGFARGSRFDNLDPAELDKFAAALMADDDDDCAAGRYYVGLCYLGIGQYSKARPRLMTAVQTLDRGNTTSCSMPENVTALAWLMVCEMAMVEKPSGREKADAAWNLFKTISEKGNPVPTDLVKSTLDSLDAAQEPLLIEVVKRERAEVKEAMKLFSDRLGKRAFIIKANPPAVQNGIRRVSYTVTEVDRSHPDAQKYYPPEWSAEPPATLPPGLVPPRPPSANKPPGE